MKIGLFVWFLVFSGSWLYADAPSIIYLKGTCSAGKSTFIRHFTSQCPAIKVVDEDSIMHQSYVDAVSKRFPTEFALITQVIERSNLYHALREREVFFSKTATIEQRSKALTLLATIQEELNKPLNLAWKQEVSRQIDLEVLQKIREAQQKNTTVLLDSWYIKPKHLAEHFPDAKVIRVLLYCPLSIAYSRFQKRNEEAVHAGNLQEKRYLRQLVGSFFSIYQLRSTSSECIDQLNKKEFDQLVETMTSTLKNQDPDYKKPNFTFVEISKEQLSKLKDDFLQSMTIPLYIFPKEEHDIIIDNSKVDVQKATLLIRELSKL